MTSEPLVVVGDDLPLLCPRSYYAQTRIVLVRSASEVDKVVERSRILNRRGTKDHPLEEVVRGRDLLERPAQIRHEERGCARDAA